MFNQHLNFGTIDHHRLMMIKWSNYERISVIAILYILNTKGIFNFASFIHCLIHFDKDSIENYKYGMKIPAPSFHHHFFQTNKKNRHFNNNNDRVRKSFAKKYNFFHLKVFIIFFHFIHHHDLMILTPIWSIIMMATKSSSSSSLPSSVWLPFAIIIINKWFAQFWWLRWANWHHFISFHFVHFIVFLFFSPIE